MRKFCLSLFVVVLLGSTGCASWFLKGGSAYTGVPQGILAHYTIPFCISVGDNSKIAGPGQSYYLTQEKDLRFLYEMDASNSGTKIKNQWVDAQGHHFYVWVKTNAAWKYSFPHDRSQPPMRYVYQAGRYSNMSQNGVVMPRGEPVAVCPLLVAKH